MDGSKLSERRQFWSVVFLMLNAIEARPNEASVEMRELLIRHDAVNVKISDPFSLVSILESEERKYKLSNEQDKHEGPLHRLRKRDSIANEFETIDFSRCYECACECDQHDDQLRRFVGEDQRRRKDDRCSN